jgi:Ni/Fe-hydrogenase subunit HybB-like protein
MALFLSCTVVGAIGFTVALVYVSALRAWEAFLVNLLFWIGLAQGGVIVSAALYLCQARWGGAGLYRLAEAAAGFLPFGFLLFWPLLAGRYWLFPWLLHPIPAKTPYLNLPFLFARDGIGFLVLWLFSWIFVRVSRRPQTVAWADNYESLDEAPLPVRQLAPPLIIAYVLIYSMLAIDLVMSLSPQWYSTMFGAYFCFGAFLSAIIAISVAASFGPRPFRKDTAGERGGVLHDLGKLVFAGSSFWTYLLFSMYLVIWFGDIPKTAFFVAVRVNYGPWNILGWTAFCLIWLVPFIALMARVPKSTPLILGSVSLASLIGFWIERYVLIAPSLSPDHIPFGWVEIVVTIGFLGLFGLATMPGLKRVPSSSAVQFRQVAA